MSLRMKILLVLILAIVYLDQSLQLKSTHPLHDLVDRVNERRYIGLIIAYPPEEHALVESGFFVPREDIPWIQLSGRRYNIGTIKGVHVIYVKTGQQTLNAGISVQLLVDTFDIKGVVHYGTAGSTTNALAYGDVSVPAHVAFTGAWTWTEFNSAKQGRLPELKFGSYNLPTKGDNSLGKIEFKEQELFSKNHRKTTNFWFPVEPKWLKLAYKLKDMKLQRCLNETHCLREPPKIVYGLRGSTANIILENAAFRKFLFHKLNISTVDEESSAVVLTSLTNGLPCIVFRGVSDLAGGGKHTIFRGLASNNALRVAVEFIHLIG